jgi:GTPase SAR1 family protein
MLSFLKGMRDMPGASDSAMDEWIYICSGIEKQMAEDVIRVAVVGPIKSGKSTFINSILKSDYLKRGAGVVTSIVTRIRSGSYLKAILFFKSWDEVNAEIEQAMTLFPGHEALTEKDRFDIRRERDRIALAEGLHSLHSDLLIANGSRNISGILLESYLGGYERVKDILASESMSKAYEDDLFDSQKSFAGSDSLAVYLKDIQLEVNSPFIDSNIEIADCQGSDSPNPLHLAMIQDYLLKTHFIVYVISSRTGLRQADMRFLWMIRQMGIIDNILFVVNCDFSEHETKEELMTLVDKTRSELSLIKADPPIHTLSSLFNLFKSSDKSISQRDALRLAQWEAEKELVSLSEKETLRFNIVLRDKLSRERYTLLLKNNIERLDMITIALKNWSRIHQDVLNRDAKGVEDMLKKIEYHHKQMDQIRSLVKSTLDGSSGKIKLELKRDVDRFFDARYGSVLQNIKEYIRSFQVDFKAYEDILEASSFTDALFLIFQDFKTALDSYVAEIINPKIVKFIREEEEKASTYLASVGEPYEAMITEAITGYRDTMDRLGIPLLEKQGVERATENFKAKGLRNDLKLPPIETTIRYSARIKTEAIVRLGFYSIVKVFKKLLKKEASLQDGQRIDALKDSIRRIKRETIRSIGLHFKDYQENIKFQYIFKMTDSMSNQLYEILLEQFRSYTTNISTAIKQVKEQHVDKEATRDSLKRIERQSTVYTQNIAGLRERIESVFGDKNRISNIQQGISNDEGRNSID